jgi:hypothetical protein
MSEPLRIRYRFDLPDGSVNTLKFDRFDRFDRFQDVQGPPLQSRRSGLSSVSADAHRDMSRRLGAATHTDPARNAIALLDAYATLSPAALECSLNELKPLIDAWQTKRIPAI